MYRSGEDRSARIIFDVTLSDASGSTSSFSNGTSMRTAFNKMAIARIKNRLRSIPALVSHQLLFPQDRIVETIFVFDGSVFAEYSIVIKVADFTDANEVASFIDCFENNSTAEKKFSAYFTKLAAIFEDIDKQRPQGSTSFIAAANKAVSKYQRLYDEVKATMDDSKGEVVVSSGFVNLDTDGGNNCGECYTAFRQLIQTLSVTSGCVLGYGAWLDQDCASKVARIIKGKTLLAVQVPIEKELEFIYRQEMSLWIQSIRDVPMQLKLNCPHPTRWTTFAGERTDNMVEILVARSDTCKNLKFELPDVKDSTETTGVIISGVHSGANLDLYMVVRTQPSFDTFLNGFQIFINGQLGKVSPVVKTENSVGSMIGHKWIKVLESKVGRNTGLSSAFFARILEDLSFNWNLPLPSKVTSYLGRASIKCQRKPIPLDKQPIAPSDDIWNKQSSLVVTSLADIHSEESDEEEDHAPKVGTSISGMQGQFVSKIVRYDSVTRHPVAPPGRGTTPSPVASPSLAMQGQFVQKVTRFNSNTRQPLAPPGARLNSAKGMNREVSGVQRATVKNKINHWLMVLGSGNFNMKGDRSSAPVSTKDMLSYLQIYVDMGTANANKVFNCDVCQVEISGLRQHCLDCFDYDMCMTHHVTEHTFGHRFKTITIGEGDFVSTQTKMTVGTSMDDIFPHTHKTSRYSAPLESKVEDQVVDMTFVIGQRRVERFLLCLQNWLDIWEKKNVPSGNSGIDIKEIPRIYNDKDAISGLIVHLKSIVHPER
jgi:hypothetical protein